MAPSLLTADFFMNEALKEAQKAYDADEVPVGAVIVCNEQIIARAYNLTERLTDATAHAEMQAFTSASNYLGAKFLDDCSLYVTIEPCVMCAGASYWVRIGKIIYGAPDLKKGFTKTNPDILHPKTLLENGVMEKECSQLITRYFKSKR